MAQPFHAIELSLPLAPGFSRVNGAEKTETVSTVFHVGSHQAGETASDQFVARHRAEANEKIRRNEFENTP